MVYIRDWQEFVLQSKQLFLTSPASTRYVWKYRPADQQIKLKVTNDVVCYQYRTSSQNDLKLIERWHYYFLKLSTTKDLTQETIAQLDREEQAEKAKDTSKESNNKKKKTAKQ